MNVIELILLSICLKYLGITTYIFDRRLIICCMVEQGRGGN